MSAPHLSSTNGLRVAVEGCGHGVLHSIYASITRSCTEIGWPDVDLVIIGGDFQAVRNADDLACVSMPAKFRAMQDFHEYYSGKRRAPYLTIFVGGNHEASNYLFELHYGGWVAPNIYYMGAANVLRVGGLRIAGMSGIWKGYDYNKTHHERLPYSQDDVKSVYHTREVDVRKLLSLRTQVDIGMSHDWPRGVEWSGDHKELFKKKDMFEAESRAGTLGNQAARYVLDRLRPRYWFSAHLHVKFTAIVNHEKSETSVTGANGQENHVNSNGATSSAAAAAHVALTQSAPAQNTDEIDLDMDDDDDETPGAQTSVPTGVNGAPEPVAEDSPVEIENDEVSADLRAQLPAAFSAPKAPTKQADLPFPGDITNKTTQFLALDKCMPHRHFLQLLSIPTAQEGEAEIQRPVKLEYDPEWLAITRVFVSDLVVGNPTAVNPRDLGEAHYRPLIEKEEKWVQEHIVNKDKLAVPEDFDMTAPAYDEARGIVQVTMPKEYTNRHTIAFCELLEIDNPFDISEQDRAERRARGPAPPKQRDDWRGGRGGRGRGGRGGGGFGRGRGRGRGRW